MTDHEIIRLYWQRDQKAIPATADKYGPYCTAIARNILSSREDAEECVSDTWLCAWNSMPPQRPARLAAFLGAITRNLSFNRYNYLHAAKRGGGELPLVLDELEQCVSGMDAVEDELARKELLAALDAFLGALPRDKRRIFLCRYWYADPVRDIARRFGMTAGAVNTTLSRLRAQLREDLKQRGFSL